MKPFSDATQDITGQNARCQELGLLVQNVIPVGIPIGLGLVLSLAIAWFIHKEQLVFAVSLVVIVPVATLFNSYPFIGIMLWWLVSPFVQITPRMAGRYVYWMVHRGTIPVALILAIVTTWVHRKERRFPRLSLAELSMLLFISMAAGSILLTEFELTTRLINVYDLILIPFCAYLLIQYTRPQAQDLKRLMPILLLILLIESVIGLMSWFAPAALPKEWLNLQGQRTVGTLDNPAVYTNTLMLCMLLLFQYAAHHRSTKVRWMLYSAFGLGLIMIFLSFSRGSWLASLLVMLGLLALYPRAVSQLMGFVLVIMLILGSGVLSDQMTFASDRLEDSGTTNARIIEAYAALSMFTARPAFGWGYDSFDRYDWDFVQRVGNVPVEVDDSSHNTYLTILAEMGAIGFVLYLFPILWWLFQSFKVLPRMPVGQFWDRHLLFMLWLAVAFFLTNSSFMDMHFFAYGFTMLWMELGLIANMVRICAQNGPADRQRWPHSK
jgi:O-antigen ligase